MKRLSSIFIIFLLVTLLPLSALAASAGEITRLRGLVDVISVNNEIRKAVVGEEVWEGEIVRTKSRSRAEIKFIDG
ncbi:MAG: hypothetical protein GY765_43675, partial [bacterium]|nr:hypothetical protein [bacterium]